MRTVAAMLVSAVACAAPGASSDPGRTITLRPGETAVVADADLRIRFDAVTGDSRCPRGAQCVWEGDAVAQVWLQQGHATGAVHALHTRRGLPGDGLPVRIRSLAPVPAIGAPVDPRAYVLVLDILGTAPDAPSDR